MKLVIDIPKEVIESRKYTDYFGCGSTKLTGIIDNGKPLDDVLNEIRAEIEPNCDRINSLASVLPYTAHREIQELLCEIMDLCKAEGSEKE